MRIIETDNFGGDYPDEQFVNLPPMSREHAEAVCAAINAACSGEHARRWWRVVGDDYKLLPGFEP
jgi:hypothetical protein